jgi:hypothetical protein
MFAGGKQDRWRTTDFTDEADDTDKRNESLRLAKIFEKEISADFADDADKRQKDLKRIERPTGRESKSDVLLFICEIRVIRGPLLGLRTRPVLGHRWFSLRSASRLPGSPILGIENAPIPS